MPAILAVHAFGLCFNAEINANQNATGYTGTLCYIQEESSVIVTSCKKWTMGVRLHGQDVFGVFRNLTVVFK